MTKNIHIVPYGGLINDDYPHLFLSGKSNLIREIKGLDFSNKYIEENEIVKSVRDSKDEFSFTFTMDNFNQDSMSYKMRWLVLVFDEYLNLAIPAIGKLFSGYITKIKKEGNSYEFKIKRISDIYTIDLLDEKWLDVEKYGDIQSAYNAACNDLLRSTKSEVNEVKLTDKLIFNQIEYIPKDFPLQIIITSGDSKKVYEEYQFDNYKNQVFIYDFKNNLSYQVDSNFDENNEYSIQTVGNKEVIKFGKIAERIDGETKLIKPSNIYYLSFKENKEA